MILLCVFTVVTVVPAEARGFRGSPPPPLPEGWSAYPPIVYQPISTPPIFSLSPLTANASPPYSPVQIQGAYGLNSLILGNTTGAGITVAIVDAYGDPTIQTDLQNFCSRFGLPYSGPTASSPTLTVSYPSGMPQTSNSGWALETALDVEWVHSVAPGAHILLVVAPNNSNTLFTDVATASTGAPIVTMSWGGSEFSGETSYDSLYFSAAGVSYFASTGDSGAVVLIYPSISPNVTAVGGTTLTIDTNNNWVSETGWSGSGGGVSGMEPLPTYQNSWVTSGNRSVPDVSALADPNTGVYVLENGSWYQVGGTSLSSPLWAGFTAIIDGNLTQPLGESALHAALYHYGNPSNINNYFHDIVSGNQWLFSRNGI